MALKSTTSAYGNVAVIIHWLSTLFILIMIGSGLTAASLTANDAKVFVLSIHAPFGVIILLLTLARVVWWKFADRKPLPLEDEPGWQARIAGAVHFLFYVVIFGMAITGIGMMVSSGAASVLFGGSQEPLPDFWNYLQRRPHGAGARLLILLFALHAGAALYHHFIARDVTLKRMWFGHGGIK